MRDLVRDFARANFVERGMVADVVIHNAKGHNPHAHILLTMRGIGPDGFGQKHRDWNQKELLEGWPKACRPNAEREHWRLSRPTPRSSTYSTIGRQSTVSAIMRLRQARNAEQLAAE